VQNGAQLNSFTSRLASSWYVRNLRREYSDNQGRIGAGRGFAAPDGRPRPIAPRGGDGGYAVALSTTSITASAARCSPRPVERIA
jgi:hypothetical protein